MPISNFLVKATNKMFYGKENAQILFITFSIGILTDLDDL